MAEILDELGYVPFDKAGADLLFGFISQRYERRSLVVTTNLPFARWSEVFLDATAAAAVIDRIVPRHRADDRRRERLPPHATTRPARHRPRRSAPSGHVATTTTTQERGSLFKWPKGCHSQPVDACQPAVNGARTGVEKVDAFPGPRAPTIAPPGARPRAEIRGEVRRPDHGESRAPITLAGASAVGESGHVGAGTGATD